MNQTLVNTTNIINGSINANKLASGSVNSTHIVDGTITGDDISSTTDLTIKNLSTSGNLTIANGTVSAPGLSFTDDRDTGLFLSANGVLDFASAGATVLQIVSSALRAVAGSAAAPAYTFTSDPDTGIYSADANILGFTAGGTNIFNASSSALTVAGDLELNGGDITGANGASIDIGEATAGNIAFVGDLLVATSSFLGLGSGAGRIVFTNAATDEIDVQTANLDLNDNLITNIGNAGTNFDSSGGLTLAGDLGVNGGDIISGGQLDISATGYVRIGDTSSPGSATEDDDLYVESDLEVDAEIYADGGITIGSGNSITKYSSGTSAGSAGTIAAQSCDDSIEISSFSGLTTTDLVVAIPNSGSPPVNISWSGYVKNATTVIVRICNPSTSSVNAAAAGNWKVGIIN